MYRQRQSYNICLQLWTQKRAYETVETVQILGSPKFNSFTFCKSRFPFAMAGTAQNSQVAALMHLNLSNSKALQHTENSQLPLSYLWFMRSILDPFWSSTCTPCCSPGQCNFHGIPTLLPTWLKENLSMFHRSTSSLRKIKGRTIGFLDIPFLSSPLLCIMACLLDEYETHFFVSCVNCREAQTGKKNESRTLEAAKALLAHCSWISLKQSLIISNISNINVNVISTEMMKLQCDHFVIFLPLGSTIAAPLEQRMHWLRCAGRPRTALTKWPVSPWVVSTSKSRKNAFRNLFRFETKEKPKTIFEWNVHWKGRHRI